MKKVLALGLALVLAVSLAACAKTDAASDTTAPKETERTAAVTEAMPEPVPETVTGTVTEPAAEPVTEAPTELAAETVTEPVTDAPTEPVTEAPAETVTEIVTEPVAEPVTEAPTEPVTEAPTEPVTEAPAEPVTEAPAESDSEPETEPEPEEPAGFTAVDERYFSDALLIGDSRTDGVRLYHPIGEAKYYCTTSMNIYKLMDSTESAYGYSGLRELLEGETFGKIYIMLGINEAGYSTESYANKYREAVEEIRSLQPDALIYIQSILYVTQNKENKDPVFSTENLQEKNERLKELANGVDIFYLEVNDALNDGTDHLPSDYTNDGVHMKSKYYYLWTDYLLEHAVVDEAHPWEP